MEVSPVLFLIFKRPETTRRVFEAIREARPRVLCIAADGPRAGVEGEAALCEETRKITELVDWPCEVHRNYRDTNRGLQRGIPEAIDWFFSIVEEGIILEDDCLPVSDFFRFASEMLRAYKSIPQIMHVNGSNFHRGVTWFSSSCFFSKYNHVWGWATWRRAWKAYTGDLSNFGNLFLAKKNSNFWLSRKEQIYWRKIFQRVKDGLIKSWDYQWNYSMWLNDGLAVTPNVNLIENIGFGEGATNTQDQHASKIPDKPGGLGPIVHNPDIVASREADAANFMRMYWGNPASRLKDRLRKLGRIVRSLRK